MYLHFYYNGAYNYLICLYYCFQDILLQNKVISAHFENSKLVLLLSKGLVSTLTISERSRDIVNVTHSKQLIAKLGPEQICKGEFLLLFTQVIYCGCVRKFNTESVFT